MWEYKASRPQLRGQRAQLPVRHADDIIDYYFKCRYYMMKNGTTVPFQALRDYLNVNAEKRRDEVGKWYSRRIIISRFSQYTTELGSVYKAALDEGWEIEIR